MNPRCPYCGAILIQKTPGSDYTCPTPKCKNEYFRLDEETGELYSPWGRHLDELRKTKKKKDKKEVEPEEWRDYEDGKKTRWEDDD